MSGRKRFYIKPTETINLSGNEIITTCTQWNYDNISKFIDTAKKLDFVIEIK